MVVRWRSDFENHCIVSNFARRKWQQYHGDWDGWHIYWASVQNVHKIFQPDNGIRLEPHQLVNHFPNHIELTRKDLMVKNIKRYQKLGKKEGDDSLDFLPATYILPNDYPLFAEEFKRQPHSIWIMKPAGRAQGRGIFLINKLSQTKRWEKVSVAAKTATPEVYVVSHYIDNPLLVGGKKFDLRLYVLVTSFKPLKVYLSDLGFARFCNVKYDTEGDDLDNKYMHLTNVAVQKHGDDYNNVHGNKWALSKLKLWLEGTQGLEAVERLFTRIEAIVVQSLKACQAVVINDRHCFELYGYDIIIDSHMKPWLIEVNASPSLAASTPADRLMKAKVINDVFNLVCPPDWQRGAGGRPRTASAHRHGDGHDRRHTSAAESRAPLRSGSLRLLYDETNELELQRAARDAQISDMRKSSRRNTLMC